jgi:hypothetical protein
VLRLAPKVGSSCDARPIRQASADWQRIGTQHHPPKVFPKVFTTDCTPDCRLEACWRLTSRGFTGAWSPRRQSGRVYLPSQVARTPRHIELSRLPGVCEGKLVEAKGKY